MVSVLKVALFFLTPLNFLFLFFYDLFLSVNIGLAIASGIGILNIYILLRIYFTRDTLVDSPFFSIDRVRSIRYTYIYFIATTIGIFLILLSFFIVLGTLGALLAIIVISLFNIIIAIFGLILLIFENSFPSFISYDLAFELFDTIFGSVEFYTDSLVANLLIGLFLLLSLTLSSYYLGRYIEDLDSGIAVITLFHNLVLMSLLVFLVGLGISMQNLIVDYPVVYSLVFSQFICIFVTQYVFEEKEKLDDYDLPEVGTKWNIIMRLLIFALTIFSFLFILFFGYNLAIGGIMNTLITFSVFIGVSLMSELLLLFSALWAIKGDFPVEIRIFEIEYREELLAKALEFKNMG